MEEKVRFEADGLSLEGRISLPPGARAGVVLCHPHPLYGGNMRNSVIKSVAAALQSRGLATLRFNFRGVGESQGSYGEGEAEVRDVLGALKYLSSQLPASGPLGLCGFSFGGMVALRAIAQGAEVEAFAGIAPVVDPPDVLKGWAKPKLILVGSRDDLVDPGHLAEIVQTMPDPKELRIVEGVDHYWFGSESVAGQAVAEFFTTYLRG